MEIIYLIVILMLVAFLFRSINGFIYLVVIFDILFRILTFIKINLNLGEINTFIGKYVPASIPSVIDKYTSGTVTNGFMWVLVLIYVMFLFLIIKYLMDRR